MAAALVALGACGLISPAAPWVSRRGVAPRACVRSLAQVAIHCVGKRRTASSSEGWVEQGVDSYAVRLRQSIALNTVWHKGDAELLAAVERERGRRAAIVCLDERGPTLTSVQFSDLLWRLLEEGGSRLSFVIGGAEGLPAELRPRSAGRGLEYLSLGRITLTHQMARLILVEQVYRGRPRAAPSHLVMVGLPGAWRALARDHGARTIVHSYCVRPCPAPPVCCATCATPATQIRSGTQYHK